MRHGGHVQRDVFCLLFLSLAVTHSFSNLFFSSIDVTVDTISWVSGGFDLKGFDSAGSL